MKASRSLHDVAYGCFLFCGLAVLIVIALPLFSVDAGALWLGLPLVIAALIVLSAGVLISLAIRTWPLLALAALSILFLLEAMTEFGPVAFYNAAPIVYGIAVVVLCGRWFALLRNVQPQ